MGPMGVSEPSRMSLSMCLSAKGSFRMIRQTSRVWTRKKSLTAWHWPSRLPPRGGSDWEIVAVVTGASASETAELCHCCWMAIPGRDWRPPMSSTANGHPKNSSAPFGLCFQKSTNKLQRRSIRKSIIHRNSLNLIPTTSATFCYVDLRGWTPLRPGTHLFEVAWSICGWSTSFFQSSLFPRMTPLGSLDVQYFEQIILFFIWILAFYSHFWMDIGIIIDIPFSLTLLSSFIDPLLMHSRFAFFCRIPFLWPGWQRYIRIFSIPIFRAFCLPLLPAHFILPYFLNYGVATTSVWTLWRWLYFEHSA